MGKGSENSAGTLRRGDEADAFSMWHLNYFTSIPSQPPQFSPTFSLILHTPSAITLLLSPPLSHLYPLYSTQFPHSYSNIMVFSFLFTLSTNKNTNDFFRVIGVHLCRKDSLYFYLIQATAICGCRINNPSMSVFLVIFFTNI